MTRLLFGLVNFATLFVTGHLHAAVILMYHHVSDNTPAATSISPDLFEMHLQWIEASGLPVLPLNELLDRVLNKSELTEAVAITFDDGYASVFTEAYPRLKARHWPFTVFVNPGLVGRSSLHADWKALKIMHADGALIANHTWDHPHLVNLEPQQVLETVTRAQTALAQNIGDSPKIIAYPYGERSRSTDQILRQMGFKGLSQHSGALSPTTSPLDIPRFPMNNQYGQEADFKLKIRTRALPWSPEPADNLIDTGTIPTLKFRLNNRIAERLGCFAEGEPIPVVRIGPEHWATQAKQAFRQRRFKYTCTAPDGKGHYYWSSWLWIQPAVPE